MAVESFQLIFRVFPVESFQSDCYSLVVCRHISMKTAARLTKHEIKVDLWRINQIAGRQTNSR